MRFRKMVWDTEVFISINRLHRMDGVNSRLPDGNHILMWDFDDKELGEVEDRLAVVQYFSHLSSITIMQSSERGFHAYCWTRLTWEQARSIVASTADVDKVFLGIACLRGHFTLRFSDKKYGKIRHCSTLLSRVSSESSPNEIDSFAWYLTKRA